MWYEKSKYITAKYNSTNFKFLTLNDIYLTSIKSNEKMNKWMKNSKIMELINLGMLSTQ